VEDIHRQMPHFALKTIGIVSPLCDEEDFPEKRLKKEVISLKAIKKLKIPHISTLICSEMD
jgi:hypothetical protein